ncbi:MAG TPA: D-2-hydroxyacid dehydrogenase [Thermoguttaceae bacterium]|nr:D-2-hydroxyacid dehydrogenase [Thermoguttaceae bacterium]
MVRIVVIDGYSLNPGDLSWEGVQSLGTCEIYDRTPAEQTVERAAGADAVLTNKVAFDGPILERIPALKYIGVLATGYDIIDVDAARRRGVAVTNVPSYSTQSVVQMVFAHLLNFTQQVGHHAEAVRRGRWTTCEDFCFWDSPLFELDGRTLGIVGFGRIGRAVARVARALGMKVLAHDAAAPRDLDEGVEAVDLETLFRRSDVVSLHCPLSAETHKLVNAERLGWMKPTAWLINTSRGPVVDETALAEALNAGRIAGAGLDVLSAEPPGADHPLLTAKNCRITPHVAWATVEARRRLMQVAVDNLRAFLDGRPRNVVNGGA